MIKQWMKQIKYKKLLLFIIVLFLVGIIFGWVYYLKQDDLVKQTIMNSIVSLEDNLLANRVNNIVNHLCISIFIIILSFTIIGIPIIYFYIFFEGLSIGFSYSIIISIFGLKGFIFCILYILFYKILFLVLVIYLIIRSFRISKNMFGLILYKNSQDIKNNILINLRKVILIFILIFIIDVFTYFLSSYFNNLLINFL